MERESVLAVLPAVVPDIPEARSALVPARLARKIGPLFGVPWAESPFSMTWVCDFATLTVSEIARGAPLPGREDAAEVAAEIPSGRWRAVGRGIATRRVGGERAEPLPNEIANATVARLGPDTKAALVLIGANKLLEPVTAAIIDALRFLGGTANRQLPLPMLLGTWSALVLDAYCSQPALFTAALQARAIQRANIRTWDPSPPGGLEFARCEVGAVEGREAGPRDFDVLDATVRWAFGSTRTTDPTPGLLALHAELVDRLVARLALLGGSASTGYVWFAETSPGDRRAHAFVPNDPVLTSYVEELERRASDENWPTWSPRQLPSIPSGEQLRVLPELSQRCVALALAALLRAGFESGNPDPLADLQMLASLDALEDLVLVALGERDDLTLIIRARVADMRVELQRQNVAYDDELPDSVLHLISSLQSAARSARRGMLDPADAAELAFSGNVELLAVLRRHRDTPLAGLPPADELADTLRELWHHALAGLGLDRRRLDARTVRPGPLAFHLHNYATFLGRQPGDADTAMAAQLFADLIIPSRDAYYRRTGDFRPLLHSLQNATAASAQVVMAAEAAGDSERARATSRTARDQIVRALDTPYTARLLDVASFTPTDAACRFALLAVPALLDSLEIGATPDPAADLQRCRELLGVATRFADTVSKIGHYSRSHEIVESQNRLDRLAAAGPTVRAASSRITLGGSHHR